MKIKIIDQTSDGDFIKIIETSYNFKEVALKLGYKGVSRNTKKLIEERIKQLGLSINHFTSISPRKLTDEDIFCKNSTVTRKVMRERYIHNKYTPYECSICGQKPYWNNKPMSLIIDHINGINNDNRLENLRWVCPNCNIQLPTSNRKKSAL